MDPHQRRRLVLLFFIISALTALFTACQSPDILEPLTSTINPRIEIIPYSTQTPTPEKTRVPVDHSPTVPPAPTGTPFIYKIKSGDTLTGIGFHFGVTVQQLLGANPGIDTGFLTIGSDLVIPVGEFSSVVLPTPSPVPLTLSTPVCYGTSAGETWCFNRVQNNQTEPVENVAVWITIIDSMGNPVDSQLAYAPINYLEPGAAFPLVATFPFQFNKTYSAESQLVSGIFVMQQTDRYIPSEWEMEKIDIEPSGKMADVTGHILFPDETRKSVTVRILAVAYDDSEEIVGVRTSQIKLESIPLGDFPFSMTVYSLGPRIAKVQILIEVRPVQTSR